MDAVHGIKCLMETLTKLCKLQDIKAEGKSFFYIFCMSSLLTTKIISITFHKISTIDVLMLL